MEFCNAEAAECRCTNPADECEGMHSCTRDGCMGQWSGVIDTPSFRVHRMPFGTLGLDGWDY